MIKAGVLATVLAVYFVSAGIALRVAMVGSESAAVVFMCITAIVMPLSIIALGLVAPVRVCCDWWVRYCIRPTKHDNPHDSVAAAIHLLFVALGTAEIVMLCIGFYVTFVPSATKARYINSLLVAHASHAFVTSLLVYYSVLRTPIAETRDE